MSDDATETVEESTEEVVEEEVVDDGEEVSEEEAPEGEETDDSGDEPEEGEETPDGEEEGKGENITLKVFGKSKEYSKDEVVAIAQKSLAANITLEKAHEAEEDLRTILSDLKEDPFEMMSRLDMDPVKAAEDFLTRVYDKEALPESDRKLIDAEQRIKDLEDRDKRREKDQTAEEYQRDVDNWTEKYNTEIPAALEKTSLPATEGVIARVANYLVAGIDSGTPHDLDQVVKQVEKDYNAELDQVAKKRGIVRTKLTKSPNDGNRIGKTGLPKSKRKKKQTMEEFKEELQKIKDNETSEKYYEDYS